MNRTEVLEKVDLLLTQRADDIELMFQTSGGWEGWLQCELALRFPLGSVQREVDAWENGNECDLFFPDTKFLVELKCLSLGRMQTSKKNHGQTFSGTVSGDNKFIMEVAKDLEKVSAYSGLGVSIAVIPNFHDVARRFLLALYSRGYKMRVGNTDKFHLLWNEK